VKTKTGPAAPLEEIYARPGHLIRRLQQIAVGLFIEETRAFNLTPRQYSALLAIEKIPGIVTNQLADAVALDRSTIGELVLRLEKRGLVKRASSSDDRRTRKLTITGAGRKLLLDVESAVNEAQVRILAPLSQREAHQFMEMLTRLVHLNNRFSRAPLRFDDDASADVPKASRRRVRPA
jgi:DNA-binding MarR family transcriptional regulator